MPIPRRLLCDEIAVRLPDGNGGYCDPVTMRHVAVQMRQSVVDGDDTRSADAGAGTVFVDATFSWPLVEIVADSRIDWNGQSYQVAKVECFRTVRGQVHHWEVEVR